MHITSDTKNDEPHEHDRECPYFELQRVTAGFGPRELVGDRIAAVVLDAIADELNLLVGEEIRFVRAASIWSVDGALANRAPERRTSRRSLHVG